MTNFTKNDLPVGSKSLISFLLNRQNLKVADKVINNSLCSVYSLSKAIKSLEAHIHKNNNESRFKKHFPLWEANLNILKGLK